MKIRELLEVAPPVINSLRALINQPTNGTTATKQPNRNIPGQTQTPPAPITPQTPQGYSNVAGQPTPQDGIPTIPTTGDTTGQQTSSSGQTNTSAPTVQDLVKNLALQKNKSVPGQTNLQVGNIDQGPDGPELTIKDKNAGTPSSAGVGTDFRIPVKKLIQPQQT